MRRFPLHLLLAVLATATGITLLSLGLMVTNPSRAESTRLTTASLTTYISAVNQALRTGDLTLINNTVADDFVEHSPSAIFGPDREGLGRYVLALRATYPDLQFALEDTITEGSMVSTRLLATGQQNPTFLGLARTVGPPSWTTLDLFRIKQGKIVEHWSDGNDIDLFSTLTPRPGDLSVARVSTIVTARLSVTGPTTNPVTVPGDTIVTVETGEVRAHIAPTWSVSETNDGTVVAEVSPREIILHTGESGFLPVGTEITITSDQATSFIAAIALPTRLSGSSAEVHAQTSPPSPGQELRNALLRNGEPTTIARLRVERLVHMLPPAMNGTMVTVAIGQVVLQPQHTLHLAMEHGARGIAVESGSVEVDRGNGYVEIQQTAAPGEPLPTLRAGEPVQLIPEDGAVAQHDVPLYLRNTTEEPAIVVVVVITPIEDPFATATSDAPGSQLPQETPAAMPTWTPTATNDPRQDGPS